MIFFYSQIPSKEIANPCILRFSPHNKSVSLLNTYIADNTLSHTSLFHYEFSINHPVSITNNLIKPVEFDNPTGLITLTMPPCIITIHPESYSLYYISAYSTIYLPCFHHSLFASKCFSIAKVNSPHLPPHS